jgi:hypothetical protein
VTIDASDVVDTSFVCSDEEIEYCSEASATYVTTVEDGTDVVSTNNSVVV